MRIFFLCMLALLLASVIMAKPKSAVVQQCADLGGTWSNFKQRCDTTHLKIYKDPKFWGGEAIIAGSWLASGIAVNHTRTGGTNIFGNQTTSGKIAALETGIFCFYSGLNAITWYAGHDDPSLFWRSMGYWSIPAVSVAGGTATAVDALNSTPTAKHVIPAIRCGRLVCQ